MADLSYAEKHQLEKLLRMDTGYVADFGNDLIASFYLCVLHL